MTWTSTKAALRTAVASAAGLTPAHILWKRGAEPMAKSLVLLDVIAARQETSDRVQPVYNVATDVFDVEASTLMLFTVAVRCESVVSDTLELVEKVRSGLALPSIRETLSAAGVVVVGPAGDAVPVDNILINDRAASAHVVDIQFRAEFNRADPATVGAIEHVETESELVNIDGAVLADSETIDR